ncbi:MAG TPA: PQQ-dependent sugar dehydrogenase [Candidatus Polarisedimenticolaceae bacterium]|nr:PQQ-dependent sugar dehydrogenase [Candidatus Polarisedimenticolaceae bacterium]
MKRPLAIAAVAVSLACAREAPGAASVPPVPREAAAGVALVELARGLDQPLAMAYAPGDPSRRLFIVEKTGRIRIVKEGRLLAEPYLNLSSRVSRGSEQGLLGLAIHPDFMSNGRLVVNYTDRDGDTRVISLQVAAPAADVAAVRAERELLFVEQPHANHNGGNVLFGPDRKLWIGLGDGGSAGDPHGNGQNRRALLGKMLRLDPGGVTGDRPVPEIVQWGLRNPWRYAFDRETGDLYIADVGQDRWEEVDVVPSAGRTGLNFGWNVMEGAHCFRGGDCSREGLVLPAVEYGHDVGCSITGGYVYRGRALPKLRGAYFYADYCTAILRSFRWRGAGREVADHWEWRDALDPKHRLSQISSFGEDEQGELYVLSLAGSVFALRPAADAPR